MILNTHYSYGAGVSGAVIVVTAPTGSTVTASLDGVVYTAQEVNGTWTFKVRKFGTYTVTATLGNQTASATVEVTEKKTYDVALAYAFKVTITGDGAGSMGSTADAYIKIGGTEYYHKNIIEVQPNTVINVSAYRDSSKNRSSGVYLNGNRVNTNIDYRRVFYDVTVDKNITIELSWTPSSRDPNFSSCSRANIII